MVSTPPFLEQVRDALVAQGARPKQGWLSDALSGLPSTPVEQMKRDILAAYLHKDLATTSEPILPSAQSSEPEPLLPQTGILQVIDAKDAGIGDFAVLNALCDKMVWKAPKPSRGAVDQGEVAQPRKNPLLTLSDGVHSIMALELSPIPGLSIYCPLGLKLYITDAPTERSIALLDPTNTRVLGGWAEEWRAPPLSHRLAMSLGFAWGENRVATRPRQTATVTSSSSSTGPSSFSREPSSVTASSSHPSPGQSAAITTYGHRNIPVSRESTWTHSSSPPRAIQALNHSLPSSTPPAYITSSFTTSYTPPSQAPPPPRAQRTDFAPVGLSAPDVTEPAVDFSSGVISLDLGEDLDPDMIVTQAGLTTVYTLKMFLDPETRPKKGQEVLVRANIVTLKGFRADANNFALGAILSDPQEEGTLLEASIASPVIQSYLGLSPAELVQAMQRKDPTYVGKLNVMRQSLLSFRGRISLAYVDTHPIAGTLTLSVLALRP
ncbi:hypothetical protein BJ684DRAFT_14274 [Piptocephalis cylindrospora]|uniref:RecQ-mediated genome instability protein 1 n=1 Tax=Piptocephalis cylindrospora TaxID=1907219 RepID=A0A4P9Y9F8_9FUNG|nr:hypothetical protein BJ684DRAFT_14274 [Piptocephalis cylindrospora]|eukprot:RKP15484.1 hypothetical protein BJ684DRAFT_14274 [Piptocephalis cylindrospora]